MKQSCVVLTKVSAKLNKNVVGSAAQKQFGKVFKSQRWLRHNGKEEKGQDKKKQNNNTVKMALGSRRRKRKTFFLFYL